jgi:hypothetical protein
MPLRARPKSVNACLGYSNGGKPSNERYPIAFVSRDYYPGSTPAFVSYSLALMVSEALQMSFNVASWRTRVERQPSVARRRNETTLVGFGIIW